MRESPQEKTGIVRIVRRPEPVIPRAAEYIFYALNLYAILSESWGVFVPLLGAGGMALLAMYCIWRLGKDARTIYRPLILPVGCAFTLIIVQVVIHDQSPNAAINRQYLNWIILLIVIQSLLLRNDFLHRFGIAATTLGLTLLPYLVFNYGNAADTSVQRVGLSVGFANPDELGAWFGFCCLFFIVVAIETRRNIVRIVSSTVAAGLLFIVGLTVTRTALGALAIAGIIAARHILKRGFLPALSLAALISVIFVSGYFNEIIGSYSERGMEDTGRFELWPLVIDRILDSPLFGVGGEKLGTYVPSMRSELTPHNGFLYVALAAGIVPLAFFVAYWIKALRGAYTLTRQDSQDAPFQLPLIIYTFIIASFGAAVFMTPWAAVTLCNALPRPRTSRIIIGRRVGPEGPEEATEQSPTGYAIGRNRGYAGSLKS